jgi:hypothetical protein
MNNGVRVCACVCVEMTKNCKTIIVRLSPTQIAMLNSLVIERINLLTGKAVIHEQAKTLQQDWKLISMTLQETLDHA